MNKRPKNATHWGLSQENMPGAWYRITPGLMFVYRGSQPVQLHEPSKRIWFYDLKAKTVAQINEGLSGRVEWRGARAFGLAAKAREEVNEAESTLRDVYIRATMGPAVPDEVTETLRREHHEEFARLRDLSPPGVTEHEAEALREVCSQPTASELLAAAAAAEFTYPLEMQADTVRVPRDALACVLHAIDGPDYLIRELKALRALQGDENPIVQLEKALEK